MLNDGLEYLEDEINLADIIKFKQGQDRPDLSHSFCFIAIL